MADIDQDSSFSTFFGADRHFVIVSLGSLQMNIDGEDRTAAYGRPETFPGEADVSVKLTIGPTSVINLITRRASCTGKVAVERIDGSLTPPANTVAVTLLDGAAWTDGQRLEPLDFVMCGPGRAEVQFKDALVAAISVFPASHPGLR
ncbi:environmental stress-induced protein Ves [Arthrobacter ginsengisoli]|uniref:Environmental stress-induced protein Ves n=1 Tax=Arthrobacter ginsengisoli TaxID=1356565 RepID=A0ABU1UE17_9MICC|nr:environmental stress-induced protein Ves [Arthrobacter ginsengisoli]